MCMKNDFTVRRYIHEPVYYFVGIRELRYKFHRSLPAPDIVNGTMVLVRSVIPVLLLIWISFMLIKHLYTLIIDFSETKKYQASLFLENICISEDIYHGNSEQESYLLLPFPVLKIPLKLNPGFLSATFSLDWLAPQYLQNNEFAGISSPQIRQGAVSDDGSSITGSGSATIVGIGFSTFVFLNENRVTLF